jgi:hypothetical protein
MFIPRKDGSTAPELPALGSFVTPLIAAGLAIRPAAVIDKGQHPDQARPRTELSRRCQLMRAELSFVA